MKLAHLFTLFLLATALPTLAEWEPRGLCYVWDGDPSTAEAPEGMLTGEVYDFNRNPQGEYFTYSGIYADKGSNRTRKAIAGNPTGSPDLFGQFAATFKMLQRNKPGILKKYYKYPYAVATPHLYMPPVEFKTMEGLLDPNGKNSRKEPQSSGSSDFINEEPGAAKNATGREYRGAPSLIAVFKGSVTAPRSMRFRFYGAADEGMLVRFNDRMVLETGYVFSDIYAGNGEKDKGCGWHSMNEYHQQVAEDKVPSKKNYVIQKLKSTPFCNNKFKGMTGGAPISVTEGESYTIEIILGNVAERALCYLLTQEVTPGNNAPLKLFRTSSALPTMPRGFIPGNPAFDRENGPDYAEDSEIWQIATPSEKGKEKSRSRRKGKEQSKRFRPLN